MEELDLDINNYSLNEILSLFKLPLEFDERDMKKAKRIVLMTHPDKSKRDKKYFLFFSSAYKILFEVYKFRQRQSNPTEYENYSLNMDNQDKNVNKILEKFSNKKGFNKKFNELFETYYIRSEEDEHGYDEWLKNNDMEGEKEAKNVGEMNMIIGNKKRELRSLVKMEDTIVDDYSVKQMRGGSNLIGEKPKYYESNMFGNFKYDDVKKVYTESVVPVSEEDYEEKQKFRNVFSLNTFRKQDELKFKETDQEEIYKQNKMRENREDMERAYKLARQQEMNSKIRENFMSSLLRITNKNV